MTARETAVVTLAACEKQGAWSDGYLKKMIAQAGLDRRDAALATRLCFGVQQNQMLLDFYLGYFSTTKIEKLEPKVRASLQIALYQLLMMDKIPPSAAVNESVRIVRQHSRNPRAAGLVNAVLRAFLRAGDELPPVEGETPAQTLSLRYSHPVWLVEEWLNLLGFEETEQLLSLNNEQPRTCSQVNVFRFTTEEICESLRGDGVEVEPHPWLKDCLLLSGTGDLTQLRSFKEGGFYIQDAAARLAVEAAGIQSGMNILDACAAPGGKSFAAAIGLENRGQVISCDIHAHKIKLLQAGRDRLGLTCIVPKEQNAKVFVEEWADRFDVVLADVPCSGLGIIRKKPDIRFKNPDELNGLPAVQNAILQNVARYVRPKGVLVYSTCTLLNRENGDVVQTFLETHPDFSLEAFSLPGLPEAAEGMLTLWPQVHQTDGFFIAKFRRQI